ncbi:hypothetical protein [Urechidicola croceus]|uniref:Secretion system C-terminal sorting domain-containing protein n=1 Tax=Urechidicola croceus TaxID=1850246 RepID=A0A1D8P3W4_9FLAO|nr:hypothetical protein [Urechidicola croceus]AOW19274.1 hypothetical protein LPB138_00590 [Urechidicola croceus]
MNTKKLFSVVLLLFCFISINANSNEKKSKAIFNNAVITDVDATLSFFIPEEFSSVYIYVADESKKVFQKVKVYQRGNGAIKCDKKGLPTGTYYYTMFVDGVATDTQKLVIK